MAHFRLFHLDTLSPSEYRRIKQNTLVPSVLVSSGLATRPGFVYDGVKERRLGFGALDYWVLKDWVEECLGCTSSEMSEVTEGLGIFLGPDKYFALPPLTTAFYARGSEGQVILDGETTDWYSFMRSISFEGAGERGYVVSLEVGSGYPYLEPLGEGDERLTVRSAYKLFSSRALFAGSGRRMAIADFPVVEVPMQPMESDRVSNRVVYRKAAFNGDAYLASVLVDNGYVFAWDVKAGAIFYSNSVAVGYGYPPVASAMGWALPDLRSVDGASEASSC